MKETIFEKPEKKKKIDPELMKEFLAGRRYVIVSLNKRINQEERSHE